MDTETTKPRLSWRHGVAVLAAVAVLGTTAVYVFGSDGDERAQASWAVDDVEFTVLEGTASTEVIRFTGDGAVSDLRLRADGLDDLLVTDTEPGLADDGLAWAVSVLAAVGDAGVHEGTITLLDGTSVISDPLPVRIEVVAPEASVIPEGAPTALPDHVEETEEGALVIGELLVATAETGDDGDDAIRRIAADSDAQIVGSVSDVGMYQIRLPGMDGDELSAFADELGERDDVDAVTPVTLVSPQQVDPPEQADRTDDPETCWDHLDVIHVREAWELGVTGHGVQVAVIDEGFDHLVDDLRDSVEIPTGSGWCHQSEDSDECHGTHVAGTICAEADNGAGTVGVAHGCSLQFYEYAPTFLGITEQIQAAAGNGAQIVNISLGRTHLGTCREWEPGLWPLTEGRCHSTYKVACLDTPGGNRDVGPDGHCESWEGGFCEEWREDRPTAAARLNHHREMLTRTAATYPDMLIVYSAGNERVDAATCTEKPSGSPNVLLVGALKSDQPAWFSNYGPGVDVWAPGQGVRSAGGYTCPVVDLRDLGTTDEHCESVSVLMTGTSMAAPHVTGVAALMLEANPDLTPAEVRECIISSANTVDGRQHLNAYEAVRCAQDAEDQEEVDGFPGITFVLPDLGEWEVSDEWQEWQEIDGEFELVTVDPGTPYDLKLVVADSAIEDGPVTDPVGTSATVIIDPDSSSVQEVLATYRESWDAQSAFPIESSDVSLAGADAALRASASDFHGFVFATLAIEVEGVVILVTVSGQLFDEATATAFLGTVEFDRDVFCSVTEMCN